MTKTIFYISVVPNDQKTPRTRTRTSFAFVPKYERLIFMIRQPKNPTNTNANDCSVRVRSWHNTILYN